jgi:hypothetical protein
MCQLLLAPISMPHNEPWRISTEAYSPECVEGKFSEVSQEFTASSSPLAMVLAGWVLLPSSSFSFPGLLVGFPGPTLPCCLYSSRCVVEVFCELRPNGALGSSEAGSGQRRGSPKASPFIGIEVVL